MTNDELVARILDEQNFPYIGMTLEQRNYYLNIVRNCKDITDTIHKVGNESKCQILQLSFKKETDSIYINGILTIEDKNLNISENRCIDGYILPYKNSIVVDMHITRLCVSSIHKEYRTLDEFKLEKNILKRKSNYNYERIIYIDNIETDLLKGRGK